MQDSIEPPSQISNIWGGEERVKPGEAASSPFPRPRVKETA
jgi:hypothetical protein